MRKAYALVLGVFLLISLVAAVPVNTFSTIIAGKIYDSPNFETANGVSGAVVSVTCNSVTHNTTSLSDGTYSVTFAPGENCFNITASAFATKNNIASPVQKANIQDYTSQFNLYLGIINIALVPEFSLGIGTLTVLSALGVFFFVRKK